MNLSIKQSKANFFDRDAVTKSIGKARAGVLAKQGAYVRTIARRSMKKAKGPADEGKPPNVHEGQIKEFLYFAFDRFRDDVIVGPVKLGKGTAPETLEKGGYVDDYGIYNRRGQWVSLRVMNVAGRVAAKRSGKVVKRKCRVAPRPFMAPALVIARPKLASFWKGKVRK